MKILIAEDDSTSRTMLEAVLSKWGYEVKSTCDGDEAWAVFQETDAPQLAGFDDYFAKPVNLSILLEAAEDAFKKLARWKKG